MISVFDGEAPIVGIDEPTRRALSQLNIGHREVQRILDACRKIGLKPITRVHKPDVCAHVGIPSLKVAIVSRKTIEQAFKEQNYNRWKAHGWNLLIATHRQTQLLTDDQLAEHLKEALRQLGKIKR